MIHLVIGDFDKMVDINITKLELINMNITDLAPLKIFTKLKYLNLCDNANISDLSPLKNLTKLTYLTICNRLTDYKLLLKNSKLENIAVLKNLTRLKRLHLSNNNIVDKLFFKKKVNDITNIDVLFENKFKRLVYLSLNYNKINNFKHSSNFNKFKPINLTVLELNSTNIEDKLF